LPKNFSVHRLFPALSGRGRTLSFRARKEIPVRQFPLFIDLQGRDTAVVGGGAAAAAKVRLLRQAGASVVVVAPAVTAEIARLSAAGAVTWRQRRFRTEDLHGVAIAYAATDDPAEAAAVSAAAHQAGVPVNVVDRPDLSSFATPAIVDRDPVTVAVSTGGAAPALAQRIRGDIEAMLPPETGALAAFAARFREVVRAKVPAAGRHAFWSRVFAGPVADAVLAGDEPRAAATMAAALNRPAAPEAGRVAIVRAGHGAADLLTLRALQALQSADVVVHDRLVGPEVLDRARRDAERIYVGKAKGRHALSQDAINDLLVRLARDGRRVVRLKGGDPFVFGRGGEEKDYLEARGIAVEVVPGITAATAAAAAAGIPLTHRGVAQAVTFVTAHAADGEPDLDWGALARLGHTLAIYMGLTTAARTAERLIAHGLDAATPAAVIENASLPGQRVIATTLARLGADVAAHRLDGPALILVGEVAAAALPAHLAAAAE